MFPSQTWYPSSCIKETQLCYTCLNIQLHNPVNNYIFIFSLIVAHFRPSPVDFGNTAQGTPVSSPENYCSPLLYILISYLVILHDLAHYESESVSHSIVSDSLQPQWLWPTRLLCPWNSPGTNTGVVPFLTQGSSNPGLLHCKQILYHLCHQGCATMTWVTGVLSRWIVQSSQSWLHMACIGGILAASLGVLLDFYNGMMDRPLPG